MGKVRNVASWSAILGLGASVAVGTWLVGIQVMLALWDPMGSWQLPRISKVTVTQIARDEDQKITGEVVALEGDSLQSLDFSKAEAAEFEVDEDVWVLFGYRRKGNRPGHFRLSPTRLLMEYPEPWILLALWGIGRLRKAQIRAAREVPQGAPKVWRDDFYRRSERFAPPKKEEGNGEV